MIQGTSMYACPMDTDLGKEKQGEYIIPKIEPFYPLFPPGPEDAKAKMEFLNKLCDEFELMRMLSNLDESVQRRILAWLQALLQGK